jgi:hypothetical protein
LGSSNGVVSGSDADLFPPSVFIAPLTQPLSFLEIEIELSLMNWNSVLKGSIFP